ncbi:MAG: hypothetical protein FWC47_01305 [Oscillospiraceae bacterium]|nr:hypothetical protein [Oscillospiraceae bacterium]
MNNWLNYLLQYIFTLLIIIAIIFFLFKYGYSKLDKNIKTYMSVSIIIFSITFTIFISVFMYRLYFYPPVTSQRIEDNLATVPVNAIPDTTSETSAIDANKRIEDAANLLKEANNNFFNGDYGNMFDKSLNALLILNELKDKDPDLYAEANVFCGIAYSYLHPDLLESVILNTYFKEALSIYSTYDEVGKQSNYGWIYHSIGDNFLWQKKWDKALDYYLLALKARYIANNSSAYIALTEDKIHEAYIASGRDGENYDNWLKQAKSNGYIKPD